MLRIRELYKSQIEGSTRCMVGEKRVGRSLALAEMTEVQNLQRVRLNSQSAALKGIPAGIAHKRIPLPSESRVCGFNYLAKSPNHHLGAGWNNGPTEPSPTSSGMRLQSANRQG